MPSLPVAVGPLPVTMSDHGAALAREEMSMDELRTGTALALSGGGFRAALFHVGSLVRLNELGLLSSLARVSSVSGGSIAAGRLAVAWNRLRFENGVAANLTEEVVAPLRSFCGRDIDKRAVALGVLSPFRTIGDVLSDIYDDDLLENTNMQSLRCAALRLQRDEPADWKAVPDLQTLHGRLPGRQNRRA
jgi:NTE family protein